MIFGFLAFAQLPDSHFARKDGHTRAGLRKNKEKGRSVLSEVEKADSSGVRNIDIADLAGCWELD